MNCKIDLCPISGADCKIAGVKIDIFHSHTHFLLILCNRIVGYPIFIQFGKKCIKRIGLNVLISRNID